MNAQTILLLIVIQFSQLRLFAAEELVIGPRDKPFNDNKIGTIRGLVIDAKNNMFFSATDQHTVYKRAPDGTLSVIAGTGERGNSGDKGPSNAAQINEPGHLALDAAGNLYIACAGASKKGIPTVIRKVDLNGKISTVAGGGPLSILKENVKATDTTARMISGLTVDKFGNLYWSEWVQGCIRKVTPNGMVTTFYEGMPPRAPVVVESPTGLTTDAVGDLYVASTGNKTHYIVKISCTTGKATIIAGTGPSGYSGDEGSALAAQFFNVVDIAFDNHKQLWLCDLFNYRIRMIDTKGVIHNKVGNPPGSKEKGFSGFYAGDGKQADISPIFGGRVVAFDNTGKLFFADSEQIRTVDEKGLLRTVIGPEH
jgi:sugar lactone lactonase YvrE